MKLEVIGIALVLAGIMVAQTEQKDVNGWSTIKWGMTVGEAKTALGDQATTSSAQVPGPNFADIERLVIKNLAVSDLVGQCSIFAKRGSDVVTSVAIRFGEIRDDPSSRERSFDELKRLLIEKYGQPKNEDRKVEPATVRGQTIISTVLWTFPSTSISLLRSESTAYGHGYVTVTYRQKEQTVL
jgi:hypothetical protein